MEKILFLYLRGFSITKRKKTEHSADRDVPNGSQVAFSPAVPACSVEKAAQHPSSLLHHCAEKHGKHTSETQRRAHVTSSPAAASQVANTATSVQEEGSQLLISIQGQGTYVCSPPLRYLFSPLGAWSHRKWMILDYQSLTIPKSYWGNRDQVDWTTNFLKN